MENQLSPEQLAAIKAQLEVVNKYGIKPTQLLNVVDGIVNGDLSDKNYKIPNRPLVEATDKLKEARRIINNYSIALKSLAGDQKGKKDDEVKILAKLTIIVSAAKSGLHALGLGDNEINIVLGLTDAKK
jgi:hypothetical protein